jgi:amidase
MTAVQSAFGANPADPTGALRVGPGVLAAGAATGPLAGSTFVVKDVFDVAATATGAGNPTWLAEAEPAAVHAEAVARCLDAGAELVGKAHTDELTFSLAGSNVHYGTPLNAAAPGRIPGGSSSGSASAVASGLCDFALGTDTGGSVRVPASYCGIFGFRPTHGRVPSSGVVPLAPSFDTVGWFARTPSMLAAVGDALLDPRDDPGPPTALVLVDDLLDLVGPDVAVPIRAAAERLATGLGLDLVSAPLPGGADAWFETFVALQGFEVWDIHGPWVTSRQPPMGEGIRARFAKASQIDAATRDEALARRTELVAAATARYGDAILVIPAAARSAPPPDLDPGAYAEVRGRTLCLTAVAGLRGAPAVSLPLATTEDLPLGVCLVGPPGTDTTLLDLAVRGSGHAA